MNDTDGGETYGPGSGHAATFGCQCGYQVRASNADRLAKHKNECDYADDTTDGFDRKRPRWDTVDRGWDRKASENMSEWGVQHPLEVLSAITEEVGEIEQAYLEATHEGEPERYVENEIDDLGPLLYQLVVSVRNHPMAFEPLPTAEDVVDGD